MAEIGISEMTIGVSSQGVEDYSESIRVEVLQNLSQTLDEEVAKVKTSLAQAWTGESEQVFEELLDKQVTVIKEDMESEYNDLNKKLVNLIGYYKNQDKKLAETMMGGSN